MSSHEPERGMPMPSRQHSPDAQSLGSHLLPLLEIDGLRILLAERDRRYQERFEGQEHNVVSALAALREATDRADKESEKRLDELNQFREQQRELIERFFREALTRVEYDKAHSSLVDRMDTGMQTLDAKVVALLNAKFENQGRALGTDKATNLFLVVLPAVALGIGGMILAFVK